MGPDWPLGGCRGPAEQAVQGVDLVLLGLGGPCELAAQISVGDQALLDLGEGEGLDQVVDGSELHRRADACYVAGSGDNEEVWPRAGRVDAFADDVEAVAVGEVEVEQHERRGEPLDFRAGSGGGRRMADHNKPRTLRT